MIDLKNQIVITDDFEEIKEYLKENVKPEFLHIIESDEFKVEDAKEAIKEAYIASEKEKYIILIANRYNIYSQNTLLKILEEPPKNIVFMIISKSKSALLPTIRSRLPIVKIPKKERKITDIDLKNFDLSFIYTFLHENQKISRDEAKTLIEDLLKEAVKEGIKLNEDEIEFFSKAIKLLELNANPINILTTVFLTILEVKGKR